MKFKINLFMTGAALLLTLTSKSQGWTVNGSNTYTNPLSNNVLIGATTSPLAGVRLDINGGNIRTNKNQILFNTDNNHGIGYFQVYTATGPFTNKPIDGPVVYGYRGGALGSNYNGEKNIALRWCETGYVGIGTNAPEDKLQVGLGITKIVIGGAYGESMGWGAGYVGFNMSRKGGNTWSSSGDGSANGCAVIYSRVDGAMFFSTVASNGATERSGIPDATVVSNTKLFIGGVDGKVGVGTTNPLSRLQINTTGTENALDVMSGGVVNFRVKSTGYVYARDLTVQTGVFPDYVFAKEYKLMPLKEVKTYIENNSHLPKMPTAAEISKEGMSVSKINTLLVEKVEELTLYVIKLQEEVDQLKNQK